jgi:hypothetical protein
MTGKVDSKTLQVLKEELFAAAKAMYCSSRKYNK